VGELDAAARIERALTSVLERRDRVTSDLGGGAGGGTRAMTQAIIEAMN
jgi:isocitrate/isopropylmalate dehydrogenase